MNFCCHDGTLGIWNIRWQVLKLAHRAVAVLPVRILHLPQRITAMARLSIEERIAQLEARKKTLQARLTKQERASDTRRKVLLGAFLLERLGDAKAAAREPQFTDDLKRWIEKELSGFLTRPNDRALFPEWIAQEQSGAPDATTSLRGSDGANGAMEEGLKEEGDGASGVLAGKASPVSGSPGERNEDEHAGGSLQDRRQGSASGSGGFSGS